MKLIIAGSRTFTDYPKFLKALESDPQLQAAFKNVTEIVCGGAKGADALGARYAFENKIKLKMFPADWDTHGKAAGPIRNAQMADYADSLLAFWDGQSRGTKNMMEQMFKRGKAYQVVDFNLL